MNKGKDLDFIDSFKRISIVKICKDVGVDRFNLVHKKTSDEATHKVAEELFSILETIMSEYEKD